MQFREFAEKLLGSKVKIKLLRYILSEEAITSERELAKLINASPGAVNKTLKEFHELNLISPLRVGNALVWQLNKESYAYNYLQRFPYSIKEFPIQDLKTELSLGYLSEIKKIIIFGSVSEGKEMPNSDIDVFILVDSEKDRNSITPPILDLSNRCIRKYGNRIEPHIFTKREFENPKNKEFLENVKKGILVFER